MAVAVGVIGYRTCCFEDVLVSGPRRKWILLIFAAGRHSRRPAFPVASERWHCLRGSAALVKCELRLCHFGTVCLPGDTGPRQVTGGAVAAGQRTASSRSGLSYSKSRPCLSQTLWNQDSCFVNWSSMTQAAALAAERWPEALANSLRGTAPATCSRDAIPASLKKHSFQASRGHAIQRQKLLSSPRFGALKAHLPSVPGGVFFSQTPVLQDPLRKMLGDHASNLTQHC